MKAFLITGVVSNTLALLVSMFLVKGFSAFKPLDVDFGEYCLFMLILIWLAAACTLEYNGTMRGVTVRTHLELKRDKPRRHRASNVLGKNLFLSGIPVFLGFIFTLVVK